MSSLPDHILVKIFNCLSLTERSRLSPVCKRWRDLVEYSLRFIERIGTRDSEAFKRWILQVARNCSFGSLSIPSLYGTAFLTVLERLSNPRTKETALTELDLDFDEDDNFDDYLDLRLTMDGIAQMSHLCPKIRELLLDGPLNNRSWPHHFHYQVTFDVFGGENFPNLVKLSLNRTSLFEYPIRPVPQLIYPKLQDLTLSNSCLSDFDFITIVSCSPALERLFVQNTNLTEECVWEWFQDLEWENVPAPRHRSLMTPLEIHCDYDVCRDLGQHVIKLSSQPSQSFEKVFQSWTFKGRL